MDELLQDLKSLSPREMGFVVNLLPHYRPATVEAKAAIYRTCAERVDTSRQPAHSALIEHLISTEPDDRAATLAMVAALDGRAAAAEAVAFYARHEAALAMALPDGAVAGPVWCLPAPTPRAYSSRLSYKPARATLSAP